MAFDPVNYEGQDRLAHIEKYVGQNTAAIAVLNGGGIPLNAKTYGAKVDGVTVHDGAITNATTALTSATAAFTSADVGKSICVVGAGAAGARLYTTIAAYVSSTQVTLTAAASTSVTGADVTWGTDDTAALVAAFAAADALGGQGVTVIGTSIFSGLVSVPSKSDLVGAGPFASRLFAMGSAAQVRFGDGGGAATTPNYGGTSGGFSIDGNLIATNPMFVGTSVARNFCAIDLKRAAGDNLRLEQTQNCSFVEVNSSLAVGSGVVLDYGAGGCAFYKCEFNLNGYANGRSTYSGAVTGAGYAVVTHNLFSHCLFEGTVSTTVACFDHGAGSRLYFDTCHLTLLSGSNGHANLYGTDISVYRQWKENVAAAAVSERSYFRGTDIFGSAPVAGVVYKGICFDIQNAATSPFSNVYLAPGTVISTCSTAIKAADTSVVEADSYIVTNATARFGNQGAGTATESAVVKHRGAATSITGIDAASSLVRGQSATSQSADVISFVAADGTTNVFKVASTGAVTAAGAASFGGGGVFTAAVTATLVQLSTRGAVGTPAFTFTNDPDCGMWSPTTNEVAFSTNGVTALRLTAAQSVTIGKAVATNATDGFPYIPAAAGAPSGVPTTQTGFVPMYYDTTNHKFWIYDGGWKGVVVA